MSLSFFMRSELRISYGNIFPANYPAIEENKKVAIFVGAHKKWSEKLTNLVNEFCKRYNAVVLCDAISNYEGPYRVMYSLLASQKQYQSPAKRIDLLIHIGDVSGAPIMKVKESWRVNPDGEIRDTFKAQSYVFEMEEVFFFEKYVELAGAREENDSYLNLWKGEYNKLVNKIPTLPFSNGWIAHYTVSKLPVNSILHLGIYNSLRHWSFFDIPHSVLGYSNTGGFGIDGNVSSMIGAALATDCMVIGVVGDLAFFYDLNSLANRHVKNNLRILLINNGLGTEFKNPDNRAYKLGILANSYIAAEGHNGKKSKEIVRHYATDLGFRYLKAENKEEYINNLPEFFCADPEGQPVIFEVFTQTEDETEALRLLYNLETSMTASARNMVKAVLGESGVNEIKKMLGK